MSLWGRAWAPVVVVLWSCAGAASDPAPAPAGRVEASADWRAADSPAPEAPAETTALEREVAELARGAGGVVGVSALHVETGRRLSLNGAMRFPMASVYKLPIALAVLRRVDLGEIALANSITIAPADHRPGPALLSAEAGNETIAVSVQRLLSYMVTQSDNTATDALLRAVVGPAGVTRRMRELGVEEINVSRTEEELFAAAPDEPNDIRDTATPDAMTDLLAIVQNGGGLAPSSHRLLLQMLTDTPIGGGRLKGLLPAGTPVAHKTGTRHGITNDAGIVTLPEGEGHLAIAVFVHGSDLDVAVQERAIAEIGRVLFDHFAGETGARMASPKSERR